MERPKSDLIKRLKSIWILCYWIGTTVSSQLKLCLEDAHFWYFAHILRIQRSSGIALISYDHRRIGAHRADIRPCSAPVGPLPLLIFLTYWIQPPILLQLFFRFQEGRVSVEETSTSHPLLPSLLVCLGETDSWRVEAVFAVIFLHVLTWTTSAATRCEKEVDENHDETDQTRYKGGVGCF